MPRRTRLLDKGLRRRDSLSRCLLVTRDRPVHYTFRFHDKPPSHETPRDLGGSLTVILLTRLSIADDDSWSRVKPRVSSALVTATSCINIAFQELLTEIYISKSARGLDGMNGQSERTWKLFQRRLFFSSLVHSILINCHFLLVRSPIADSANLSRATATIICLRFYIPVSLYRRVAPGLWTDGMMKRIWRRLSSSNVFNEYYLTAIYTSSSHVKTNDWFIRRVWGG